MPKHPARPPGSAARILIVVATLFAIAAAYGQLAFDLGQSPEEFAADSDATLRVAGFAFSIWGAIYLGLATYAVWQAWPGTPRTLFLERMAWPSVVAFVGIGLWIVASALDWEGFTILLIVGSAATLTGALWSADWPAVRGPERWLAAWPLGALAGWLTIASAANVLTVLTGNGQLPSFLSPTLWAVAALGVVALVAATVTARTRLLAYPVPVVWGLVGVFAAEQSRNLPLAYSAAGIGAALAVLAIVFCLQAKRSEAY